MKKIRNKLIIKVLTISNMLVHYLMKYHYSKLQSFSQLCRVSSPCDKNWDFTDLNELSTPESRSVEPTIVISCYYNITMSSSSFSKCPSVLIVPELWLPNRYDLDPVDYKI